jgi:hypothetical protein
MTIKYTVTRMGDKSDRGPSGEFGFMVQAESGGNPHDHQVHRHPMGDKSKRVWTIVNNGGTTNPATVRLSAGVN